MNPYTNKFEELTGDAAMLEVHSNMLRVQAEALRAHDMMKASPIATAALVRPDGSYVPATWSVFTEGETVEIKGYTFKLVRIGEGYAVIEPVGPALVGGR